MGEGECFNSQRRYFHAVMLFFATLLAYSVRSNMGVVVSEIETNTAREGMILSAFFYGYILLQIPATYFVGRFGPKNVLLCGVIGWSICDFFTKIYCSSLPPSSSSPSSSLGGGFLFLLVVRFGVGLCESILFPCLHSFAGFWYPSQEKATLVTIAGSGANVGTVLALSLTPQLKGYFGVESVFVFYPFICFIWAIIFYIYGSSYPEKDRFITDKERKLISEGRPPTRENNLIEWRTIFSSRGVRGIILLHMGVNYGWYVLLMWTPKYLEEKIGVDLKEDPIYGVMPFISAFFFALSAGRFSDYLVAKGVRVVNARKILASLGTMIPAIAMLYLGSATTAFSASLLLTGAIGLGTFAHVAFQVNMIDLLPSKPDQILGVSNTAATLPGIIGNTVSGFVLQSTGSWNMVFSVAAFCSVAGNIAFYFLAEDVPITSKRITPVRE